MRNLGLPRTKAQEYFTNIALVAAKVYRASGALLLSFRSRDNKVLWAAFNAYIFSVLNYASVSWKPNLRQNVVLLENVQRRYSKRMWSQREQPYAKRLPCLSAVSLKRSRDLADLLYGSKIIHGLAGLSMDESEINLQKDMTRGSELRLSVLLACTEIVKSHFKYRIATLWNVLLLSIVSIPQFNFFRSVLYIASLCQRKNVTFHDLISQ